MNTNSSRRMKHSRNGTGYPGPMRAEYKVAVLTALAACGWWRFGPDSVGSAILATPLVIAVSLLLTATVSILISLPFVRRAGSSPFIMSLGPLRMIWVEQSIEAGLQRRESWFSASIGIVSRPGKREVAPEGAVALHFGMAAGALVCSSVAVSLLYLSINGDHDLLMIWGAFLLTAAATFELIRFARRYGAISDLIKPGPGRQALLAADLFNHYLYERRPPAQWSLDLIDEFAASQPDALPPRAMKHYLAYVALLDRGNVVAAGERLDTATETALQAIRSGKSDGMNLAGIFSDAAYFTAFHRGDAVRARAWLELCNELWLDGDQRGRAEAAILFAQGDIPAARELATRLLDVMKRKPSHGADGYEVRWVAEILRACDGEPQRPESILARGRSSAMPPLVINGHGGRVVSLLIPWLCLTGSFYLVAWLGDLIQRGGDGPMWHVLVPVATLLLAIIGIMTYVLIAHSWIEVSANGMGYALSRKLQWLEWSRFRGSGRVTRTPLAANGLILNERVTLEFSRGPVKQIGGIPLSSFAPHWRDNQLGAAIHHYAPHLMTTRARPIGWFT